MNSFIENDLESEEEFVDPALEKFCQAELDKELIDYHKLAEDLCAKVDHIHSAYLFVQKEGRKILRELCKRISSTPSSIRFKSWKDLAAVLGLDCDDIGCIENSKQDYTELVLLTFAQNAKSSLSQLVLAFESIQRYDVLAIAAEKFPGLCQIVEAQNNQLPKPNENPLVNKGICLSVEAENNQLHKPSENVHDNDANRATALADNAKKKLLIPYGLSSLKYLLPFTLRDDENDFDISSLEKNNKNVGINVLDLIKDSGLEHIKRRVEVLTNASIASRASRSSRLHKKYKRVMLTFASDGLPIAKFVQSEFKKERDGLSPIGVLILDQHAEKVVQNPERFISHQFAKMDYIIPILTAGYLEILCNKPDLNSLSSLDSKYIHLIHDHMSKYYWQNHCTNDKIRCYIPSGPEMKSNHIRNHPHIKIDHVFDVYEYDIETLFMRLAKAGMKRK